MHDRFDACSQVSVCLQMALVFECIPLSAQSQQERSDNPSFYYCVVVTLNQEVVQPLISLVSYVSNQMQYNMHCLRF